MPDYNKLEASLAKQIGAKLVKNSGRGQFSFGDMLLGDFMVDAKFAKKSFGLSESSWGKVCTDAAKAKLEPALIVVLGEEDVPKTRVALVSMDILLDYVRLRELEEAGEL